MDDQRQHVHAGHRHAQSGDSPVCVQGAVSRLAILVYMGCARRRLHGGEARGGRQHMTIARSGMPPLTAVLDRVAKSCEIQGKTVQLGDHNVVLVNVADSPEGVKIEKTLRVDPVLPSSRQIEVAIRRSPELIEFMGCDRKLPNPRQQATMDVMCARYSGR